MSNWILNIKMRDAFVKILQSNIMKFLAVAIKEGMSF